MITLRRLAVLTLFLILSAPVSAQTSTFKLGWTQTPVGNETFASLASYQWTLKVDAAAPVVVVATCTPAVAPSTAHPCSTPLAPLTSGTHTLILTAFNGFGSTPSAPFSGGPPTAPLIVSVTVTVTVP